MKHIKNKWFVIGIAIIFVLVMVEIGMLAWRSAGPETYAVATRRCGTSPVIGSGSYYYVPGSANNGLLSEYDPTNLNLSQYTNPKYFCSAKQAGNAGYKMHPCCGVPVERSKP
jgi:hypothetical protein